MGADPTSDVKAARRKAAYARRAEAKRADDGSAAREAAARFLADVDAPVGAVVAGYRPIRSEIDPTPLMSALGERGARLCLPVIVAAGAPLRFRAWTVGAPLVDGPFGASVPADGDWLEPTVLIAPLVAFDRRCVRLGYGGGFYDRSLAELDAMRPTTAIGFAYAAQEDAELLPMEPTDRRLDGVVTERAAFWPDGVSPPAAPR